MTAATRNDFSVAKLGAPAIPGSVTIREPTNAWTNESAQSPNGCPSQRTRDSCGQYAVRARRPAAKDATSAATPIR
jgi:hypothetical protein